MNLTFDQAIEEHRKMWRAIAKMEYDPEKHIGEYKKKYLSEIGLRGDEKSILSNCFCCEYLNNKMDFHFNQYKNCANYCPVMWTEHHIPPISIWCCVNDSPYKKLYTNICDLTQETFRKLCLEIAELPINEKSRLKFTSPGTDVRMRRCSRCGVVVDDVKTLFEIDVHAKVRRPVSFYKITLCPECEVDFRRFIDFPNDPNV